MAEQLNTGGGEFDPCRYRLRLRDCLLGAQMLFVAFGALVLVPLLTGLNSNVALSTLIGAESVDVLICTEEVYEQYNDQNGFVNLEELLSEEALAGGKVQGDALVLEKNDYMTEKMGVSYEPAYVCVMENAKHKENAAAFVEMLLENVS